MDPLLDGPADTITAVAETAKAEKPAKAKRSKTAAPELLQFRCTIKELGGRPFECEAVDAADAERQTRAAISGLVGGTCIVEQIT